MAKRTLKNISEIRRFFHRNDEPVHCVSARLCRANRLTTEIPFSLTDLSHGFRDRYAERGVAVQDGDPDR
jgi:hypothetical protein